MSKTIEDILKGMPLDDSVKAGLKESWESALADAKVAQEAQVRGELKEQYDTDLEKIHEAFSQFLEERIKPHIEELQEGVESVEGMKARYAEKIAKIKEAAADHLKRRINAMEQVVEQRIREELSELHEDVVANRRATLQVITEKTAEIEAEKQKFREKAVKVMENIINVKVPAHLEPLREDIEAARQDNFGRELFEAFQTVFRRQFFNTSKEFQKLVASNKALKEENSSVKANAKKAVKESEEKAIAAKRAYGKLNESVVRNKAMSRLLKPLTGTARVQMKTLLEATKTEKLDETFRKALPQIVKESKTTKRSAKTLNENKGKVKSVEFRSGSTEQLNESAYDEFADEVASIKRLAGNS